MGLYFTSIALITENIILIDTLFCALFVMESLWSIDFFYNLFFHNSLLKLANYAFIPGFSRINFLLTFYHPLIPI